MNKKWTYGFYIDQNNNKISPADVLLYKNSYNSEYSLNNNYYSQNEESVDLDASRQHISFNLLADVVNITFNSDIFGIRTLRNSNNNVIFSLPFDDSDDLPYIEFIDYQDNKYICRLSEMRFVNQFTISTTLPKPIINCTKIKFVSYKPKILTYYVSNISDNFVISNDKLESLDALNLINIEKNDIFIPSHLDPRTNLLVLNSQKSIIINDQRFASIEIDNRIFLYQQSYNSGINLDNFYNAIGGLYIEDQGSIRRVLFTKLKPNQYYNNIKLNWLNQQANNSINNLPSINIDDFENISYALSDKVLVSKLEVETLDRKSVLPTPNPTNSVTPSISLSPSATPRESPQPSSTPLAFDYVYTWSNTDLEIISDIFRKSDISTFYKNFTVGADHAIVEVLTSNADRIFLPFGKNDQYQTGLNLSNPKQSVNYLNYTINNIFQDPYKISCGSKFSYIINKDKQVYRWGSNKTGQLSLQDSDQEEYIQFPRKLNNNFYIDVSAGVDHVFLINDRNELYFSGQVHERNSRLLQLYFTNPDLDGNWEKVFSCKNLTFAKKVLDSKLYLIGGQYDDRLLNGDEIVVVDENIDNFIKIAVGPDHAFILKSDHTLHAFGDNSKYQLGKRNLDNAQNYANFDNKAIWVRNKDDSIVNATPTPTPTTTTTTNAETTSTPTPTASLDIDESLTPTPTVSIELEVSSTPTTSLNINESPTPTPTISTEIETSPTPTGTPQLTAATATPTPSISFSPSVTPSISLSSSITPSISVSPSITASPSNSGNVGSVYDAIFSVGNIGSSAYTINGIANSTLNLVRGGSYQFNINSPGHPFYIKTANVTGTGSQYNNGVSGNGTSNGTIIFNVPLNAPDVLYYVCEFHASMNGTIVIDDVSNLNINSVPQENQASLTGVGTNGRSSYYGTYDQNGNVHEMVLSDNVQYTDNLPILGGSFRSSPEQLMDSKFSVNCNTRYDDVGFRLCASSDIAFFNTQQEVDNFVLVEYENNQKPDTNGLGYVPYPYSISKYPVQNKEYAEFLNYNIDNVDAYELWEDVQSDLQGIYFDGNEYLCKPNMEDKPVNFLLLSNKIRYVNWKYNSFYYKKNHKILNRGVYLIDVNVSQFSMFGGSKNIEEKNLFDLAYDFDLGLIRRTGESDSINDPFIWMCNIDEWYKAAYYNPETQKYNKYATNTDTIPNPIVNVDVAGNGDNGGTIYNSNQFFISINDSQKWIDVSAGDGYSLGVSEDGLLYGWGSNENHSLSRVERLKEVKEPTVLYDGIWRSVDSFMSNNVALAKNITNVIDEAEIIPTNTPTPTQSLTPTVTNSSTVLPTPTVTPTISISVSKSSPMNPQVLPIPTPTPSPSITASVSKTPTRTINVTPTNTPSTSLSGTPFVTKSPTPTPTRTETPTPTVTITKTPTKTPTPSVSGRVGNVLLLLTDTLKDQSEYKWNITSNGAVVDPAVKKQGLASIKFNNRSPGRFGFRLPETSRLDIETDDFTLEFWLKMELPQPGTVATLFNNFDGNHVTSMGIGIANNPGAVDSNGRLSFGVSFGGVVQRARDNINGFYWYGDTDWHHVAITRKGNAVRVFVDGQLEAINEKFTHPVSFSGMLFGDYDGDESNVNNFSGWIDNLRLTKYLARYTTNFDPESLYTLSAGCYNYQFDPKTHIFYSTAFANGDKIPENGTITRNNPLYIGDVAAGDYVDVSAWGQFTIGWGCDPYGPDGSIGCSGDTDGFGNSPPGPIMGRLGMDPVFKVGSSASFRNESNKSQPFYIFFTDIQSSDNRGYLDIAVNISKSSNTAPPCVTPTNTPTNSVEPTKTPTNTTTPTVTSTMGATPTITPTKSPTQTNTPTVTRTVTPTGTLGATPTTTPTKSPTQTNTPTVTRTVTPTGTLGATPTTTPTKSPTQTNTPTVTRTVTPTGTLGATPTITPTKSPTGTNSG